jgi:hypothetical protein
VCGLCELSIRRLVRYTPSTSGVMLTQATDKRSRRILCLSLPFRAPGHCENRMQMQSPSVIEGYRFAHVSASIWLCSCASGYVTCKVWCLQETSAAQHNDRSDCPKCLNCTHAAVEGQVTQVIALGLLQCWTICCDVVHCFCSFTCSVSSH